MVKLLVWVHALLYRGLWAVLRLPFRALWAAVLAVVALLGEEFRRWAGLVVWGVLLVGAGKLTVNYAPAGTARPLALTLLLLTLIWALAVRRAAHWTRRNNLVAVRNRKAFRELKGDVGEVRGRLTDGLARATQGTPADRLFKSNREDRAKTEAKVEADRLAADADERHRGELADLEPDPYTWERT